MAKVRQFKYNKRTIRFPGFLSKEEGSKSQKLITQEMKQMLMEEEKKRGRGRKYMENDSDNLEHLTGECKEIERNVKDKK
ncbi:hypothetical protein WN51_07277 [Melipona quadrifasciata]|uniref:Uncharacterized protein n=1 Tax=Melipona quadrifasciata TaxID=166423 RepID=A0A0N0BCC5_9HYME|nr:hypothetical protein WN51_07277 [Melipona quadrifasciata]